MFYGSQGVGLGEPSLGVSPRPPALRLRSLHPYMVSE